MWNKIKLFYRRSKLLRSLRTRIFIIVFLIGLIPCLIVHYGILTSYQGRAVSVRTSDVRAQMRVIANHLISYSYMDNPSSYTVNAELDLFSTLNDGRVLVVNDGLEVVKDTYGISEGKTIVMPEVVNCLEKGTEGESSVYDKDSGYIVMVTPIVETAALESGDISSASEEDTEIVRGVLVTSVSTDTITQTTNLLSRQASLIELLMLIILIVLDFFISSHLVRPFDRLTKHISEVREGFSTEMVEEPAYYETEQIVGAFNRVLQRMRSLDESRSDFVSNVSHELKTPMDSMKVLADSLLSSEDVPPEMYREFLMDIDAEIDRENQIIGDLLNLVKMDNRAVQMNITSVNIGDLAEVICKRVRPLAGKQDIEITLVVERPVVAEIDEVKMTLVLTNLIENAVKYNKEHGKVSVHVDADHQDFTVTVKDTGIGIPEDELDKIYDRFYRVDKSHSKEIGGTGLGLAIAQNVIRLHRGTIRAESKLGEGTTFTMRVPLSYNADPKGAKLSLKANPGEDNKEQLKKNLKETEKNLRRTEADLRRTEAALQREKFFLFFTRKKAPIERTSGELTVVEKLADTKTIDVEAINAALEAEEKKAKEADEENQSKE